MKSLRLHWSPETAQWGIRDQTFPTEEPHVGQQCYALLSLPAQCATDPQRPSELSAHCSPCSSSAGLGRSPERQLSIEATVVHLSHSICVGVK